jgi:hypothetical protein
MSVQTSYPLDLSEGLAGQQFDMNPQTIVSMNNPAVAIYHGRAVEKITGDEDGIKLPDNGSANLWGVAVKDPTNEEDYYEALEAVAVMTQGRIYVPVEEAVTPDDSVYVRYDGKYQVQTFVLDADLVAGNTIAVDVDGNTVSYVYAASHLASMQAFAALLAAQPGINTAVVGGAGNRTITITGSSMEADVALTNASITGGATQAGITITETVDRISVTERGKFRTDADSTTAMAWAAARYVKGASAGAYAVLEINLP